MNETMPKSYLSDEEIQKALQQGGEENLYLEQSRKADEFGDDKTAWEWLALTKLPAHSLSFLKKFRGAEFIKKYNFNTKEADEKFGKDWLNK